MRTSVLSSHVPRFTAAFLSALLTLVLPVLNSVAAQEAQNPRISGVVQSVDGERVTLTNGQSFLIGAVNAIIEDIQPGTISDLGPPRNAEASFDVVTLWDVLEHTTDPKSTLQACRRLLKPGGMLVVNYPDIGSWIARGMGRRWVFLLSVHLTYFTPATLERMLRETDLEPFMWKPHIQFLEVGYLLYRLNRYVPWLAPAGSAVARTLHLEKLQLPYWVGQTLVLAKRP